jgi:hypothetical protein
LSRNISAPAIEIITAWKEHLRFAYSRGSFPKYDIDSANHWLANFKHDNEDLLGQFFRAIQENKPELASNIAQKIMLIESVPS